MNHLIALARSAKGATALTIATAVLAAGFTAKVEYDAEQDELRLSLRKVKPIMHALKLAQPTT